MDKICANCAWYVKDPGGCARTQHAESEEFSCAAWTSELEFCSICQRPLERQSIAIFPTGARLICKDCMKHYGTCAMCVNADCEFEQNPDPMPKIVQKRIQQGNMVQIAQIKNPDRIEKFCPTCSCWNKEYKSCEKEYGCCPNHKGIYD